MDISGFIDHTLLRSDATEKDILQVCSEAIEYKFFGVCVNSSWVSTAKSALKGSGSKVISVIGFPLGVTETTSKVFETTSAIRAGADEIDMVLHLGFFKSHQHDKVQNDIRAVVTACEGRPMKVILETYFLTDAEKEIACRIAVDCGAQFVKTCTGFQGGRAEVRDIELMRKIVGPTFGVKASGGIKTREDAIRLLEAGANRLGTSSGIALIQNKASTTGY